MPCRIADPDVATEELAWQPVGSPGAPRTIAASPGARLPSPETADRRLSTGSHSEDCRQNHSDLEAQRAMELEKARQGGYDQGLRQARQEAAAEMEGALDRLARSIQEVSHVKRRVRTEAENELVKLSLAIARRILHRELTTDPQSLSGIVHASLQRLQNREIMRIKVFPAAVTAVKSALERNGGITSLEVVADPQLQPGGLFFETSMGELDASVETQLQEIERGFADRLQIR